MYINASAKCLGKTDTVYHASLRFIANCGALTHPCCILEWDGLLCPPGGWDTGALLFTRPCLDYCPPTYIT